MTERHSIRRAEEPLRILMVGTGENYHLEPLARCIRIADPSCRIACHGLFRLLPDGRRDYLTSSSAFDAVYQLPQKRSVQFRPRRPGATAESMSQGTNRRLWLTGLRVAYRAARWSWASHKWRRHFEPLLASIDIVHLQSLFPTAAYAWLLGGIRKPLVISCWGSDILRESDPSLTLGHLHLLNSAGAITTTGIENREVILAKYGRRLEARLYDTYFNPGIQPLLNRLGSVPPRYVRGCEGKWRVCLGHNGFEQGNHRRLLASVAKLPESVKQHIELLIPMTYGATLSYREEIRRLARDAGCTFRLFDAFMPPEAMVALRRDTDILVFAAVSDGFSATVSQALAAASVVIVGAWLPYKTRRMTGFHYHEMHSPDDAGTVLATILHDWRSECDKAVANSSLAATLFAERRLGEGWLKAYQGALDSSRGQVQL